MVQLVGSLGTEEGSKVEGTDGSYGKSLWVEVVRMEWALECKLG